jgi:hypothetical protein
MKIKDHGVRRSFGTGAVRDIAEGKGRFDLLPFLGLEAVAKHFENGAKKYKARNWEQGIPLVNFLDSAGRHISKAIAGWSDEPHAEAACWNMLCFLHTRKMIELGALPKTLLEGMPIDFDIDDFESIKTFLTRLQESMSQGPKTNRKKGYCGK